VNSAVKNIVFWVVMAVTALLIWAVVKSSTREASRSLLLRPSSTRLIGITSVKSKSRGATFPVR